MEYARRSLSQLLKKIAKLFKLTWKDKLLLLEALLLTGVIRFAILFVPFNKLAKLAGKAKEESSGVISVKEERIAKKISWTVFVVSNRTPWESKCLVRALTAQIMLSTFKIGSTLYLGVARDEQKKLIAHAWLRSGQNIVTGAQEMEGFTEVARFANNGRGK